MKDLVTGSKKLKQVIDEIAESVREGKDLGQRQVFKSLFANKCEFGVFASIIKSVLSSGNLVIVETLNYENLFEYGNLFARASKLPVVEFPHSKIRVKIIPVVKFPFDVDIVGESWRAIETGITPLVAFFVLDFMSFDSSSIHLEDYKDMMQLMMTALIEKNVYVVVFTTNQQILYDNVPILRYAVVVDDPVKEVFKEYCPEKTDLVELAGFGKVARHGREWVQSYLARRRLPMPHTVRPVSRDIDFNQMILPESLKEFIRLMVINPLKKYTSNIGTMHSILLMGPSGCGKTTLGCAIASEIGVQAYQVYVENMLSKWIGESEKITNQSLMMLNEAAPAVGIFRNIELIISSSRGGGEETVVYGRIRSIISNWMRSPRRRFFVVFTTSNPDMIPDHVLQDPLFGIYKIPILPPLTDRDRKNALVLFLSKASEAMNVFFDPTRAEIDEALNDLARRTVLFTVRELRILAEAAVMIAKEKGLSALNKEAIQLSKKYIDVDRVSRAESVKKTINACKKVGIPEALVTDVHRLMIEVERLLSEIYAEEAKRKGMISVMR